MQSILIIGLGRFGRNLCRRFTSLGHEVMIVDKHESLVTDMADGATSARIGDCTDEHVMQALGVSQFDVCFVCIGSDFASSLLITSMLRECGARRIIAKANQDIHARLLLKNGADEIVDPERDSAQRLAVRASARNVFDYIELTEQYAIYEIPVLREWVDKSVGEIGVRNRYRINILAVKTGSSLRPLPGASYVFTGSEHILALASIEDAQLLLKKVELNSP